MNQQFTSPQDQNSGELPNTAVSPDVHVEPPPTLFAGVGQRGENTSRRMQHRTNFITIAPIYHRLQPKELLRKLIHPEEPPDILPKAQFDELVALLRKPDDWHWCPRVAAAWLMGVAPLLPEQRALAEVALSDVLSGRNEDEAKTYPRRFVESLAISAGLAAIPTVALLSMCLLFIPNDHLAQVFGCSVLFCFLSILGMFIVGPLRALYISNINDRVLGACLEAIGRLEAVKYVGLLADSALSTAIVRQIPARAALYRLLPLVSEDYYGQLEENATLSLATLLDVLCQVRTHKSDRFLTEMLLGAIARAGDGRAIPFLERILKRPLGSDFLNQIREALPILYERRRQEEAHHMLLRGSAQPIVASELLRPSTASFDLSPPEELLRPHIPEIQDEKNQQFK